MTKSTIEIKIRGYHTDGFGHVNHARYLEFMEEGRWDYFETKNLTHTFQKAGFFHVVVNINIDYRKAVLAGETLIYAGSISQAPGIPIF